MSRHASGIACKTCREPLQWSVQHEGRLWCSTCMLYPSMGQYQAEVKAMSDRPQTWKHFEVQLKAIMEGTMELPNFEQHEDLARAIGNWACLSVPCQSGLALVPLDPMPKHRRWARYMLGRTQGGQPDGTGEVLIYNNGHGIAGKFAICRHKKVPGAGADPRRGWHPGYCAGCGLDMTVDSGD